MTKWTAEKDAFSNGLIDTGITVFHVCDLTSEEETLRLLTDIAERHNADIDALTAERDRLAAEISATNAAYATLLESHELILDALTESDATLDRLRAVGEDWIRGGESLEGSYEAMTRMYAILNPENET